MDPKEEAESACPEQDASDFDDFGVSGGIGEDVDEEAEDSDEELEDHGLLLSLTSCDVFDFIMVMAALEKEALEVARARAASARRYAEAFPGFVHASDVKFQEVKWQYENEGIKAVRPIESKVDR
jgi:hypothetical protein